MPLLHLCRRPRLLAALGTRYATRDAAAMSMVKSAETSSSAAATQLATQPGATLHVAGTCAALTVKTNMETYVAEAWAELDGQACDARTVADFQIGEDEIRVSALDPASRLTLAVPAAFEVSVSMGGDACDVDVAGWLEGCVQERFAD